MGLLDKLKRKAETTLADSRLEEELMYKHAFREMNAGLIREGLYAKALAKNSGNEEQEPDLRPGTLRISSCVIRFCSCLRRACSPGIQSRWA